MYDGFAHSRMLPEHPCLADAFNGRAFCGTYSKDGSKFISAVQGMLKLCSRCYVMNSTMVVLNELIRHLREN